MAIAGISRLLRPPAAHRRLFITKSVEELMSDTGAEADGGSRTHLKRTLKWYDVMGIGIGAIIGAGIFVLTGVAAAKYAGPSIVISFVLTGITCALVALCYAEFASMIPLAGSAYTYSYVTMGELVAWIIGWDLILEYGVGAVAVSVGWSGYARGLMAEAGMAVPSWAVSPVNFPAMLIVIALTLLLLWGMRESARVNMMLVMTKVFVLVLIILVGAAYFRPDLYWKTFYLNGWPGVMTGAGLVFFAYIGFDAASVTAEEAVNPQKTMPIGIIGSLLVSTVIYISFAAVLTGIVPLNILNSEKPVYDALAYTGLNWLAVIASAGAIAGITSVLFVSLMAMPRIMYALSRDGLLPKAVGTVHQKYKTPYLATLVTGISVAVFAGVVNIGTAAELTNIGTLFAFLLVSLGIILLRKTRPDLPRPFRCPLVPWVPLGGVIASAALILSLPAITWMRFLIWLGLGLLIYANYGMVHSRLARKVNGGGG